MNTADLIRALAAYADDGIVRIHVDEASRFAVEFTRGGNPYGLKTFGLNEALEALITCQERRKAMVEGRAPTGVTVGGNVPVYDMGDGTVSTKPRPNKVHLTWIDGVIAPFNEAPPDAYPHAWGEKRGMVCREQTWTAASGAKTEVFTFFVVRGQSIAEARVMFGAIEEWSRANLG